MAGKVSIRKEGYGPRGKRKETKNWYVHYTDRNRTHHEIPAYRDKRASEVLGEIVVALDIAAEARKLYDTTDALLMKKVSGLPKTTRLYLIKRGFIPNIDTPSAKPLVEHIVAWSEYLTNTQTSDEYRKQATSRVKRITTDCGFVNIPDIVRNKVVAWGNAFIESGNSTDTLGSYYRSLKSFFNWLVQEGIIDSSPMKHLKVASRVPTPKKKPRRALHPDQIKHLLAVADTSPSIVRSMAGPDRALLYQVALETGLRWSELYSLRVNSFDLDNSLATVTVEAAHSKRRREDVIPLRKLLVEKLRNYISGRKKTEKVFKGMLRDKGAKMLRFDLEVAKIPAVTDEGEVDFHSLRHSFITQIVMAGTNPKMAQTLARHSNVELTLGRYSHVELAEQLETLEKTLAQ